MCLFLTLHPLHVPWAHSWETLLAVLAKKNTCLYVSVHTKVHMRMGVEM